MRRKIWVGVFLLFLLLAYSLRPGEISPPQKVIYGFSFSPRYAQYLGLDPKEAFSAALSLGPKIMRLPIYWDRPDPEFLDWAISEMGKKDISVILTVGYRNFRYPECYSPGWVKDLPSREFRQALFKHLKEQVAHFSPSENLFAWQVENEPFDLPLFRRWCRHFDSRMIAEEIQFVKESDPTHPVILNFGGEVLFRRIWQAQIETADVIGVSFYPETRTPLGNIPVRTYEIPLSPRNITAEKKYFEGLGKNLWVTEFQAEPWGENTFTTTDFAKNLEILERQGGAEVVLFWGVEWWHLENLNGRGELWDFGKKLLGGK